MRVVVGLGGNALLRRDEAPTLDNQRAHLKQIAPSLAAVAAHHDLVVSHGNGPQVGLLALQGEAYSPAGAYPLDVLDAESEGAIGEDAQAALREFLVRQPAHIRRDDEAVAEAARVALRRHLFKAVGKKPITRVHVVRMG